MKTEILKLLREQDGYLSGQQICETLGVSRTAVWKVMNQLKEEGYQIEAVPNKGYHLLQTPDILSVSEIESRLTTDHMARKLYYYDVTDSTNTDCKRYMEEEGVHGTLVVVEQLRTLPQSLKDKTEFLCNECCWFGCKDRKACYEAVSRKTLGEDAPHRCTAPGAADGYRFSRAMENLGFISAQDIRTVYLPMGFTNFKLEGRGLGSAILLEFLLYYLTKPEHQLHVREAIYLDAMLDLF